MSISKGKDPDPFKNFRYRNTCELISYQGLISYRSEMCRSGYRLWLTPDTSWLLQLLLAIFRLFYYYYLHPYTLPSTKSSKWTHSLPPKKGFIWACPSETPLAGCHDSCPVSQMVLRKERWKHSFGSRYLFTLRKVCYISIVIYHNAKIW
jgi:hypothetical protein